jgi:hypothetical protein
MWLELLNFIIGIAFGFFHHGKEDYMGLLRNGAIVGAVMGIVYVLVSMFLVPGDLSISLSFLGVFGIFVLLILFVVIFIVGAFIGDWLDGVLKNKQP